MTRLKPGEHILQVSHAFEVSGQEHGQTVRLLKDQVFIGALWFYKYNRDKWHLAVTDDILWTTDICEK